MRFLLTTVVDLAGGRLEGHPPLVPGSWVGGGDYSLGVGGNCLDCARKFFVS